MRFTLIYPASTQSVLVADVPRDFAYALHPEPPGYVRTLLRLDKRALVPDSSHRSSTEPLTEDDTELLMEIWQALPGFPVGKPSSVWTAYADAFERAANKPNWLLEPRWSDEDRCNRMLQAEHEHRLALIAAIHSGQLVVRSPASRAPTDESNPNAIVMIDALKAYASKFLIDVVVAGTGDIFIRSEQAAKTAERTSTYVLALLHKLRIQTPDLLSRRKSEGANDTDIAAETPKERRAKIDISTERGCRRLILENWDNVEKLYGPNADGRQVRRVIKRFLDEGDSEPALKTVQNHLIDLRKEGLIP